MPGSESTPIERQLLSNSACQVGFIEASRGFDPQPTGRQALLNHQSNSFVAISQAEMATLAEAIKEIVEVGLLGTDVQVVGWTAAGGLGVSKFVRFLTLGSTEPTA